jgi:sulfur carrier protein ThiS
MQISVNIYAYLRHYLPNQERLFHEKKWNMPDGATVAEVLEKLKLPKEVRVTILVNHNSVDPKAALREGDIIHILPQMVGG